MNESYNPTAAQIFVEEVSAPDEPLTLWYRKPATQWESEALPVGNGRLAAMVFGGVERERIQFNHESVWAGEYLDRHNPKALDALPEVRRLLFEGKNDEATRLAEESMMGIPPKIDSYQTLGDLLLDFQEVETVAGYRRELDLTTGIARVSYRIGEVTYTREVFASAPDQVIVVRLTADGAKQVSFTARFDRLDATTDEASGDQLVLSGKLGVAYEARLLPRVSGGSTSIHGGVLTVTDADEAILFLTGATSYVDARDVSADPRAICRAVLEAVRRRVYSRIHADHVSDHQRLFNRVHLDLGSTPAGKLPTDERLEALRAGGSDPELEVLYFQYGRYLLMGSSRPGSLPANLQGKWCQNYKAPWNSDYHFNINFQMNYWLALVTNLAECHEPYFDYLESLVPFGEETAKRHYGADGWVVHHLSDIFGKTTPADGVHGVWPMGAAWAVRDFWESYRFNGDRTFLAERAYPILKGAAEFILDFLVDAPDNTPAAGFLVTAPSHSPENAFIKPDGSTSVFTYAATMDLQIVHDLFTNVIEAIEVLDPNGDFDVAFRKRVEAALARLLPLKVSPRTGRLQEWVEDYEEKDPKHRHVSHLYGLHPGRQITRQETPMLYEAARKTLEARGDRSTGWSMAWKINFWARLHGGDRAHQLLQTLLCNGTLTNLLDTHPPFQIDGNFGGTAAIAEMLLQSHTDEIELLPSLPAAWSTGSVRGLRARGGATVDLQWSSAEVSATIHATRSASFKVRYRDTLKALDLNAGSSQTLHFKF